MAEGVPMHFVHLYVGQAFCETLYLCRNSLGSF